MVLHLLRPLANLAHDATPLFCVYLVRMRRNYNTFLCCSIPATATLALTVVLVVMLTAGGCSGSAQPAGQSDSILPGSPLSAHGDLAGALAALPTDREASLVTQETIDGIDTYMRQGITNELGTTLELLAGMSGLAYAIYRFNPGMSHLTAVEVVLSVFSEQQTYVAVADYSLNHWDIQGPVTGTTVVTLNDAWHRSAGGNYYIAVLTGAGSSRVIELNSSVDSGWTVVIVDAAGSTGIESRNTSLAIIDGKPAIAYYAGDGQDLKYAWSSTLLGDSAADWSSEIVDSAGRVGEYCSMANVNGVAGISYSDYSNGHLKYARRVAQGDWMTRAVDETEGAGAFTSLAVVSGKPCISYYMGGDVGDLMYIRSSSDYGLEEGIVIWPKIVVDDSPEFDGIGTSIAEVDGTPAIAYYSLPNFKLKYARSSQADGLNDNKWASITFDGGAAGIGLAPLLGVVDGRPTLVYTDYNTSTTVYRRANNANGIDPPSWPAALSFDPETEYSSYDTSFAVIGGYPAVAYRDRNTDKLKYAVSSSIDGSPAASWTNVPVDNVGDPGHYCSLADVAGRPAISYIEDESGDLKYAVFTGP